MHGETASFLVFACCFAWCAFLADCLSHGLDADLPPACCRYYARYLLDGGVAALCALAQAQPLFAGLAEIAAGLANICKVTQSLLLTTHMPGTTTSPSVSSSQHPQAAQHRALLEKVGGTAEALLALFASPVIAAVKKRHFLRH